MKKIALFLGCAFAILLSSAVQAEGLLQLWALIVENNPTLKSAEFTIDQARAQQDQALAKLLPNVSLSSSYSFNSLNPNVSSNGFQLLNGPGTENYTGVTGSLRITQVIFDLPSFLRLEGAKNQSKQNEQQALVQRMQVALNLVDFYLNVLEASDSITQLEVEQKATDERLKRLRFMNERQMVKVTDLYEIESYSQALTTLQIEAQHKKEIALERLRELTGMQIQDVAPLIQDHFPEMKRNADEWVQEALAANPLLQALQYASESAQSLVDSAKAGHLPTATINASEVYSTTNFNNLQSSSAYNIGSLYFSLNIPIYSGGGIEASTKEAFSKFQLSREKIEEVKRTIERDTRTTWLNLVSGRSKIQSNYQETVFRENAMIALERSNQLGTVTIIEVLDAHNRLLKAKTDYFKTRYDFIRNLIRLRLTAGALPDLDLEAIAPWFATH